MEPTLLTSLENLQSQLYTILIFLERPVVRTQLIVLVVIVLLSWLFSAVIDRQLNRYMDLYQEAGQSTARRILLVLDILSYALIALLILQLSVYFLGQQRVPVSLLVNARPLFFIVLGYEALVALLYWRYEPAVIRLYHYRVLLPLFIGIVTILILDNLLNLEQVAAIPLLQVFDTALTVGIIVRVLVIIYIFGTAAYLIQDALERVMTSSGQNTATTTSVLIISRYVVLGIGLIVLAAALGVNTATLAVIGGGLSIGIGFGLQQIVANFIAGILLLFEQSLRPGDVIDINGTLGTVDKLNIRSTSIVTNDNVEIIVPNEQFLTSSVTTYTRNNQLVRVPIYFGVSYSSDPKQVRDLVLETVKKHGLVRSNPAPQIHFMAFGDSSLDFRVLVWMDKPVQMPRFRSDLYFMIWETFARHEIGIPFPQRDLNLGRGWEMFRPRDPAADDPADDAARPPA